MCMDMLRGVKGFAKAGFGGLLLVGIINLGACGGSVEIGGGSGDSGNSSGSSNGGTSGSPNSNAWVSYCNTRASNCAIPADTCIAQEGCAKALLRDDIEEFLFDCLKTSCNEDECFAQITTGFAPSQSGQAFLDSWQAYINACPMGNDDISLGGWIIADDRLGPFKACAEKPDCAQAEACFQQVDEAEVKICKNWL